MTQKISISILALIFSINAIAQKNVYLTVKHKLGANSFAYNQATTNDLGNNLNISRVDYYMSKFVIIHDSGKRLALPDNVIILAKGSANVAQNLGSYNVTNIEGITFSIGVPSSFNNSDPALYVSPNPLAPQSPSMHWGWAAGFRFVALEGMAGTALKTLYEMHGLGNDNYFSQTKMVSGVGNGNNIFVNLDADYTKALKGVNVSLGPIDHAVDATDLTVLRNFRDFVFSPGTGFPVSIESVAKESGISIYPNPSNGELNIINTNMNNILSSLEIKDVTGRMVSTHSFHNSNNIKIDILTKGIYFMQLKTTIGETFSHKIIIN